jgi:ferredoxin
MEQCAMAAIVDKEKCTGCGICEDACPQEAITVDDTAGVDAGLCTECGVCVDECPNDAIHLPG